MYNKPLNKPPMPPKPAQYIGARYVPIFADPVEWSPNRAFEPLTIVTYLGNSYTSKKPVPINIDPSNSEYWVLTGNFNAQLDDLSGKIDGWDEKINAATETANTASETAANAENTAAQANQTAEEAKKLVEESVQDYGQITADLNTAKEDIKTNSQNIATVTQAANGNTSDINSLKSTVADNAADIKSNTEAIKTNSDNLSSVSEQVTTHGLAIANIRSDVETNTTAISKINTSLQTIDENFTTVENELNKLKEQTAEHASSIQENTLNISTVTTELTKISDQIGSIKTQSDAATEEVTRLTNVVGDENSGLIKEFNDLKTAIESGETVEAISGRVQLLEASLGKPSSGDTPATGLYALVEQLQNNMGDYLPLAGGTLTGAVTTAETAFKAPDTTSNVFSFRKADGQPAEMLWSDANISESNAIRISGVAVPENPTDAANKSYVDDAIQNIDLPSGFLPLAGGNMTGNIVMESGSTIQGLPAPTTDTDAANKSYVDDAIQNIDLPSGFLPLAGGNMTGNIVMESGSTIQGLPAPTADTDAANKSYVDEAIKNADIPTDFTSRIEALEQTVGDASSGLVKDMDETMADVSASQADISIIQAQQSAQDTAISGATTAATNAASKADAASTAASKAAETANAALPKTGGIMTGAISFTPRNNDYTVLLETENTTNDLTTLALRYINKNPQSFSLAIGSQSQIDQFFDDESNTTSIRLRGIETPLYDNEASNKKYVDDSISAISIGANYRIGSYAGNANDSSSTIQTLSFTNNVSFIIIFNTNTSWETDYTKCIGAASKVHAMTSSEGNLIQISGRNVYVRNLHHEKTDDYDVIPSYYFNYKNMRYIYIVFFE